MVEIKKKKAFFNFQSQLLRNIAFELNPNFIGLVLRIKKCNYAVIRA